MSTLKFAVRGGVPARGSVAWRALFDRSTSADDTIRDRTAAILARVRREGDAALRALALELDGATLASLEVPRRRWRRALDSIDPALRHALERAAQNIHAAHKAFRPAAQTFTFADGVVIKRRAGIHSPGSAFTRPAGARHTRAACSWGWCRRKSRASASVIVCSPPARDGLPAQVLLAAAELADADRVFAVGGAGAVAAMAWGTESIARVDRIVGPGNAYVAEAKLQAAGVVAIDAPAGPSELLVIADESANLVVVAREMNAQAEHDSARRGRARLDLARTVTRCRACVRSHLPFRPSRARRSFAIRLPPRGGFVTVSSIDKALAFLQGSTRLNMCSSAAATKRPWPRAYETPAHLSSARRRASRSATT